MNSAPSNRKAGAFTLIEVLCVVAIIAILAALFLPTLNRGQARARRIQCVDNLKELGVGFHAYMYDHKGRFPMQTPMSEGGTKEFVQNGYRVAGEFYFSFRHFAVLSNEIVTPKILACPADTRWPAASFASFNNESLSYFVGVYADFSRPYSILAGDRNVTNDKAASLTIVRSSSGNPFRWTQEMHRFQGNLLFADGHVQELNDARLSSVGSPALNADLVLPSSKGTAAIASTGASASSPNAAPPALHRAPTSKNLQADSKPAASENGLTLAPVLIVSARGAEQSVSPPETGIVVETNQPVVSTNTLPEKQPAATPPADPGGSGSGFTDLMEEIAGRLNLPVWLLYSLLFFFLVVIGTLVLRLRSK